LFDLKARSFVPTRNFIGRLAQTTSRTREARPKGLSLTPSSKASWSFGSGISTRRGKPLGRAGFRLGGANPIAIVERRRASPRFGQPIVATRCRS
jgi:hypothetical protein